MPNMSADTKSISVKRVSRARGRLEDTREREREVAVGVAEPVVDLGRRQALGEGGLHVSEDRLARAVQPSGGSGPMDAVNRRECVQAEPVEVVLSEQVTLPRLEVADGVGECAVEQAAVLVPVECDVGAGEGGRKRFEIVRDHVAIEVALTPDAYTKCDRVGPALECSPPGIVEQQRTLAVPTEDDLLPDGGIDVVAVAAVEPRPVEGAEDHRPEFALERLKGAAITFEARDRERPIFRVEVNQRVDVVDEAGAARQVADERRLVQQATGLRPLSQEPQQDLRSGRAAVLYGIMTRR